MKGRTGHEDRPSCAYCGQAYYRKAPAWRMAWQETRYGRLVRLAGYVVPHAIEFLVCDPCHRRLPVDRAA